MTYKYNSKEVLAAAQGQWLEILANLAPQLQQAIMAKGRHVPCPLHGGKDGFRLYKDAALNGGAVSNKDGSFANGVELLKWLYGWEFKEIIERIGDLLGCPTTQEWKAFEAKKFAKKAAPKAPKVEESINGIPATQNVLKETKGRLLEYGRAPYLFDENKRISFFVTVAFKNGAKRTIWGIDLERAIHKADADIGNYICIQTIGYTPVVVEEEKIDEQSGEVFVTRNNTHRNTFKVINLSNPAETTEPEDMAQVVSTEEPKAPVKKLETPSWLAEAKAQLSQEASSEVFAAEKAKILATWSNTFAIGEEATTTKDVEAYFTSRALTSSSKRKFDDLRCYQNLAYYEPSEDGKSAVKVGEFSTLVAAMRNPQGEIVAIHRTYLDGEKGGKAPVGIPRKMKKATENISGAVVRLGEPLRGGIIGLSEGIETSLAVTEGTGIPTWATTTAQLMANFVPPEEVKAVVIFADKDLSGTGLKNAKILMDRLKELGVLCTILEPKYAIPKGAKGIDWNDVLVKYGKMGFPQGSSLLKIIRDKLESLNLA